MECLDSTIYLLGFCFEYISVDCVICSKTIFVDFQIFRIYRVHGLIDQAYGHSSEVPLLTTISFSSFALNYLFSLFKHFVIEIKKW
ncbi:unnamed protein product, partial [Cylicocyclus nassatus]